jgi:cell division protein FtsB
MYSVDLLMMSSLEMVLMHRLTKLYALCQAELRAIRTKIAQVTRRKQESIATLRTELQQLQNEARGLQASVDQLREASVKMR